MVLVYGCNQILYCYERIMYRVDFRIVTFKKLRVFYLGF